MRFEHLTFGYTSTEPVLARLHLTVAAGETVALVGGSGSGKSTVGLLLPRFYDVHGGSITIDGHDVRDVTLQSLRRSIGVVFEDSFLFSDSITDEHRVRSARRDRRPRSRRPPRAAEAHEFIMQLPVRLRDGGRRARTHAVGRSAAADRAGPSIALGPGDLAARRRDVVGRRPNRRRDPRHAATDREHAHDDPDRAPALDVVSRRPHRRRRQGPRSSTPATNDELWRRCQLFRMLLSGPGDDAEGIDAAQVAETDAERCERIDGLTPAGVARARSRRRTAPRRSADATRPPGAAQHAHGRRRGRRWRRRLDGRHGRLARGRRPSCSRRSTRSSRPPPTPTSTSAAEAAPVTSFRFLTFLRRYRGWLFVGMGLVAIDAVCTLAGPLLLKYGIDQGVAKDAPTRVVGRDRRVLAGHAASTGGSCGPRRG